MTAHGYWHGSASSRHDRTDDPRAEAAERAVEQAERAAAEEWSILVRPRRSRKAYVRQIAFDVAVALLALLIIALLS